MGLPIRFSVKNAVILAVILALFACATPSVAPNRSPASIASHYGLDCIGRAKIFQDYDESDDPSANLDPELGRSFDGLTGEARSRAIALALADAYAYGQSLLNTYDSLLNQGQSLEFIMRTNSVYAELHSLYFIRHGLSHLAARDVAGSLLDRLSSSLGGNRSQGIEILKQAARDHVAKWKSYIAERLKSRDYETLALSEMETDLEELQGVAESCGTPVEPINQATFARRFGENLLKNARQFKVMATAHSLVKDSAAFRAFEPREGERGPSIAAIVKSRAVDVLEEWKNLNDRSPQSAPVGKVIYPDAGKPGNIFGTKFPKGVWALTFDDGPHGGTLSEPSFTKAVLENLKKHDMKATFFVLSQHLERTDCPGVGPRMIKVLNKKRQVVSTSTYNILKNRPSTVFPELALAERDAGHAVASHSYYHSVVPKDNDVEQNCEINLAMDVFTDKLGVRPTFFRLPYGAGVSISKVRAKIAAANAIHVYWSVDTLDWQDHDPASIVNRTLKAIQTGGRGVILFHDIHPQSVIASEQIMAYLKDPKNKLETVTLPEIVDRLNGAGPH